MHLYLQDDYFVLGVRNHRIITTSRAIRTVSVRNMGAVFSWLCKHICTSDGADSKSNNNVHSCTVVCILEKMSIDSSVVVFLAVVLKFNYSLACRPNRELLL